MALALFCGLSTGTASAGTVTFDVSDGPTPALISLSYDDDEARTKLKFRGTKMEVGALLGASLTVEGVSFDLTGPTGGSLIFDRKANSLTFLAAGGAAEAGGPVRSFTFFFAGKVKKPKRLEDLVTHLSTGTVTMADLVLIDENLPAVTLPGAAYLFLGGLGALVGRRMVELGGIEPPTS